MNIVELARKPLDGSKLPAGEEHDWTAADKQDIDASLESLKEFIKKLDADVTKKLIQEKGEILDEDWPLLNTAYEGIGLLPKITYAGYDVETNRGSLQHVAGYEEVLGRFSDKMLTLPTEHAEQAKMYLKRIIYLIVNSKIDYDTTVATLNSLYDPLIKCAGGMHGQLEIEFDKLNAQDLPGMVVALAKSVTSNFAAKFGMDINERNVMNWYITKNLLPVVGVELRDPSTSSEFDEDYLPTIIEAIEHDYTLSKLLENITSTIVMRLAGDEFTPIVGLKLSGDDKKLIEKLKFLDISEAEVENLLKSKIKDQEFIAFIDAIAYEDINDYKFLGKDVDGEIKNGKLHVARPVDNCLYIKIGADDKWYLYANCRNDDVTKEHSLSVDTKRLYINITQNSLLDMFKNAIDQRRTLCTMDANKVIEKDFIEYKALQGLGKLHLLQDSGTENEFKSLRVRVENNIYSTAYLFKDGFRIYFTDRNGNYVGALTPEQDRIVTEQKSITFNDWARIMENQNILIVNDLHRFGMQYPDYIHANIKNPGFQVTLLALDSDAAFNAFRKYISKYAMQFWEDEDIRKVWMQRVGGRLSTLSIDEKCELIKLPDGASDDDIERRLDLLKNDNFDYALLSDPVYANYIKKKNVSLLESMLSMLSADQFMKVYIDRFVSTNGQFWRENAVNIGRRVHGLAGWLNRLAPNARLELIKLPDGAGDEEIKARIEFFSGCGLFFSGCGLYETLLNDPVYLNYLQNINVSAFELLISRISSYKVANVLKNYINQDGSQFWQSAEIRNAWKKGIGGRGLYVTSENEKVELIKLPDGASDDDIKARMEFFSNYHFHETLLNDPVYLNYLQNINVSAFELLISRIPSYKVANVLKNYINKDGSQFWQSAEIRNAWKKGIGDLGLYVTNENEKIELIKLPDGAGDEEIKARIDFFSGCGLYETLLNDPVYLNYLQNINVSAFELLISRIPSYKVAKVLKNYINKEDSQFWQSAEIRNAWKKGIGDKGLYATSENEKVELIKLPDGASDDDIKARIEFFSNYHFQEKFLNDPVYLDYFATEDIKLYESKISKLTTEEALHRFKDYITRRREQFWQNSAVRNCWMQRVSKKLTPEELQDLLKLPDSYNDAELHARCELIEKYNLVRWSINNPVYVDYFMHDLAKRKMFVKKINAIHPLDGGKFQNNVKAAFVGYMNRQQDGFWKNPDNIWNADFPLINSVLYSSDIRGVVDNLLKFIDPETDENYDRKLKFIKKNIHNLPMDVCLQWIFSDQKIASRAFSILPMRSIILRYWLYIPTEVVRRIFFWSYRALLLMSFIGLTLGIPVVIIGAAIISAIGAPYVPILLFGLAITLDPIVFAAMIFVPVLGILAATGVSAGVGWLISRISGVSEHTKISLKEHWNITKKYFACRAAYNESIKGTAKSSMEGAHAGIKSVEQQGQVELTTRVAPHVSGSSREQPIDNDDGSGTRILPRDQGNTQTTSTIVEPKPPITPSYTQQSNSIADNTPPNKVKQRVQELEQKIKNKTRFSSNQNKPTKKEG